MAEMLEESDLQLREEYIERLTEVVLVQFTRNLDETDAELLWGLLPQLGIKMVSVVIDLNLKNDADRLSSVSPEVPRMTRTFESVIEIWSFFKNSGT
jgi:flagellin-specific chaperone FliS